VALWNTNNMYIVFCTFVVVLAGKQVMYHQASFIPLNFTESAPMKHI
jgi:hypothetical protein